MFINQSDNNSLIQQKRFLWKNPTLVMILVVFVFSILGISWPSSKTTKLSNSLQAAQLYYELTSIINNKPYDHEIIIERAQNIINLYPDLIYADLAYLEKSKQYIMIDQLDQASMNLLRVIKDGSNVNLKVIAKLRLSRIELAKGNIKRAIEILNDIKVKGYEVSVNILLGDIYAHIGGHKKARSYWEAALSEIKSLDLENIKNLLQIRLDNFYVLNELKK